MKVIQLLPFRFWGGPEIQSFQLASQLHLETVAQTDLILYTSPSATSSDLELVQKKAQEYGLKIFLRQSPSLLRIFSERLYLKKFFLENKIDLITSSGYLCDLLAVGQKIKKISIVHGWTGQNFKIKFYEKIDRALLRFFDAVGCVSQAQLLLLNRAGIKAHLITNSLDPQKLPPAIPREQILKELNLPDSSKLLLCIGRLSAEKGQSFVLNAFKEVFATDSSTALLLIGDGPEEENLRKLSRDLGLAKNIFFLGKKDLAAQWMSACDLFILPSLREGLPVVLLEALSQNLPVVCTAVGGCPELIIPHQTGLLAPPANANRLAEEIKWALENPEPMKSYTRYGQKHMQENFSLQKQSAQWQEMIRYALSN